MPLLDIRNLTIEIDTPQGKVKAVDRVSLTLNAVSYTHLTLPTKA